jgi:hypothetical protein
MSEPIWFLGPDDDLIPLVCPERDFDMTPVRYGGVFQGLSGARSMTNTGIKRQWTMDLSFLEQDEYDRLLVLLSGDIPPPYRLISPFHKNLLSPQAAMVKPVIGVATSNTGFAVFDGPLRQVRDWPSAAGVQGKMSTGWTIVTAPGTYARLDSVARIPVTAGQTITGSIYIKSPNAGNLYVGFDWFDINGVQLAGSVIALAATATSWTRRTVTATPPAGATSARMILVNFENILLGAEIQLAAAQVEKGSVATSWSIGGGAPRVLIDQLVTKSPRFPYRTATLTLLEE